MSKGLEHTNALMNKKIPKIHSPSDNQWRESEWRTNLADKQRNSNINPNSTNDYTDSVTKTPKQMHLKWLKA